VPHCEVQSILFVREDWRTMNTFNLLPSVCESGMFRRILLAYLERRTSQTPSTTIIADRKVSYLGHIILRAISLLLEYQTLFIVKKKITRKRCTSKWCNRHVEQRLCFKLIHWNYIAMCHTAFSNVIANVACVISVGDVGSMAALRWLHWFGAMHAGMNLCFTLPF
jgi:hypothetical protein